MTTPVADKNSIPPKIWRRHSDPPSLWIFASISSVSLHLLVFWWLRSLDLFGLGFSPESSAIVPIDIIELPATTKLPMRSPLSTKQVSPKPKTSSAKSRQTPLPNTAQTTPKNQTSSNIAPVNPQPLVKKTVSQPKPSLITKPKPTPTPINNLPWNRPQQIVLGKGKPLEGIPPEKSTPDKPPTSPGNSSPTPSPTTSSTPTTANATPTPQTPQTPSPAGLTLKVVAFLSGNEVNQLRQEGRLKVDALPDVPAKYQGSNTKKLPASSLNGEAGLAPAQLLASFVIDQNGIFQQAVVLEIEPSALQSQKSIYQQAINELFTDEKFTPGQNQDGSKPELSNLYVKIIFLSASQN